MDSFPTCSSHPEQCRRRIEVELVEKEKPGLEQSIEQRCDYHRPFRFQLPDDWRREEVGDGEHCVDYGQAKMRLGQYHLQGQQLQLIDGTSTVRAARTYL